MLKFATHKDTLKFYFMCVSLMSGAILSSFINDVWVRLFYAICLTISYLIIYYYFSKLKNELKELRMEPFK